MKSPLTKKEAKQKIESFFKRSDFSPEACKKIKRLAMRYKIRLGPLRKNFCKSCLNPLKGAVRVTKISKTITCKSCKTKNRHKIK
jgi:RNase P subunit RPR2